ncbi:hypothetical protein ACFQ49_09830 [Kroppenstedtia eburnea]|uniref:Uncharacterized protein n=1 Tax=Kroppenstedtia eburnea TaxID=714067 RepID=A0A1N7KDN9_9BACL|nr:hypothetical protein [Kroppenstedtia eburnea]EGK11895.1 amino acid permease [Desmospora sp. 8437]QKI83028.1 hypothetical protein GXN75_14065 [Kroppenstedtia eburnea]SIS59726.1 hypothetical protein SAMN05421790_10317 [Kroppenstedtia eburnea]
MRKWGKRLLTVAGTGLFAGWVFGLNVVPDQVAVEQGDEVQWVPLPPGMYWLEVIGFAVWVAMLVTLTSAAVMGLTRLIRAGKSGK